MTRESAVALFRDHPPEWAATWKVADVLRAVPGMGPVKAARLLRRAQVAESKTLGGLSPRQRDALAEGLRGAGA
jgi:hypothetical protein